MLYFSENWTNTDNVIPFTNVKVAKYEGRSIAVPDNLLSQKPFSDGLKIESFH